MTIDNYGADMLAKWLHETRVIGGRRELLIRRLPNGSIEEKEVTTQIDIDAAMNGVKRYEKKAPVISPLVACK